MSQGAGIDLSVCGYSLNQTVLLQLHHVGYLEVYMRTEPSNFLNDRIDISNDICDMKKFSTSFLQQLSRFDTMVIMWKYYRAMHTYNKWERRL